MKKLIISIVLVNLLAGCASEPKKEEAAPAPKAEAPKVVPAQAAVDALDDPASILAKRSVYYPFDVAVVQDADKPVVQAHAKYLSEHANRKVRLEGNCDERGSNEYNLGLGQRRADGVNKMLVLGGAKSDQLESVSYGEEKPRASGHEEASWSQNRRTDLNYTK
ncbi:MAG: peptidoglycan-associated lipoprotein Pal [Gallionella sp.]|nr:peptidoglycan-associated lipoprotein Pal [Gallionella sp.]